MSEIPIVGKSSVVVDGDMSAEKLVALIRLGREEDELDYKAEYDLSSTRHKVELTCDLVAMTNSNGGYIVVGVGENSEPGQRYSALGLSNEQLSTFDITSLRSQVESYLGTRLEIYLQIHSLADFDHKHFALIYVPQSRELPIIFASIGSYQVDNSGRQETKFRKGDIYVRRGAASIKADHNDMRRIVSHIRRREKDAWTEDILGVKDLVQRLDTLIDLLGQGKAPNIERLHGHMFDETMFYIDNTTFEQHIYQLLETGQLVSIERYLREAISTFFNHIVQLSQADDEAIQRAKDNHLSPILDNLVVIGAVAVFHNQNELFSHVITVFHEIFQRAEQTQFPTPKDTSLHFSASWVWKEVIVRIYALGALLVRQRKFAWLPVVVRREVSWDAYYKGFFWARFTIIKLSQERRLEVPSLCLMAVKHIQDNSYLSSLFFGNEHKIIEATCQYDLLQAIHVLHEGKEPYPSFGVYYNNRTEPIISELIRNTEARQGIPQISNGELASFINWLNYMAAEQFFMYAGWERNEWSDQAIKAFLSDNLSSNTDQVTP